MQTLVTAYSIYLPVMIALTIWVARTMHKNTRAFLLEIFPDHENVASAVNNLLQTGFYLIALGFGFIRLRSAAGVFVEETKEYLVTNKELVELLAMKLGGFTLFVGALLFFNLILMLILRKSAQQMRIHDAQIKTYWEARKQAGV
jgi:hypothetical protein